MTDRDLLPEEARELLGVRLASFDEVEDIGRSGSLMDGGADAENGPWWTAVVDWADDAFIDSGTPEVGARLEAPEGLDARVVTQHGPGGGWPEVRVMGGFDALMAFLADHYDEPDVLTMSRDDFADRADWDDRVVE